VEGQVPAEYALIMAVIAVVAIAAGTFIGADVSGLISKLATGL
jgi:Flp pilus assembly pilin Flp